MAAASSSHDTFPLHDLCIRAISSPSSVTPNERALILARPDPAAENDLYIAATSLPLSALVAKSLLSPPTITHQEAQVLLHGPVQRTPAERAARLQSYQALNPEHRSLLDRASEAVTDPEEKRAKNVAYQVLKNARQASSQAPRRQTASISAHPSQPQASATLQPSHSPDRRRAPIVFPWERADWITLVSEKNYTAWGLPVLCTAYADPAAWLTFKTRFSALATREIHRIASASTIARTFSVQYIEDEDALAGAEQAGLVAYYAKLVREGTVGDGYQWDVFVSVDEKVLEDLGMAESAWAVPVWEAGWRVGDVGNEGWNGALGMIAGLVFALLVPKLVRGDKRPLETLRLMAADS